jgi:ABC-type branched-subunit amino acid transport system ATPase component
MAAGAMLEVSQLRSGYGRIPILDGVSFAVAPGEVVGVLGHNGMGKTTLLKALAGELPATAGVIRFGGRDVTRWSMAARARAGIGYVPQGQGVFPGLTAQENLRMGALGRNGAASLPELLEHFPILEGLLGRPARTLSGGERQILGLARGLARRPRLLLLDEPSEGVQPSIVEDIMDRLKSLVAGWDLTILLVEQNLRMIAALAERVLIMQRGRVTAELPPGVLADPALVSEYMGL